MTGEGAIPSRPTMKRNFITGENSGSTSTKNATLSVSQIDVNEGNVDYNRIYEYTDLSFGIPAVGNREINPGHIRSIYKHMDEDLLGEIKVDIETKSILDGNHRWLALEKYLSDGSKLKNPIRVIYVKRRSGQTVAEAISEFNNHRKNWTAQDYIISKKSQGDKYASELSEFCLERPMLRKVNVDKKTGIKTITPIMRYGGWFIKGCNCSPLFKKGNYAHTQEELEKGKVVYDEVVKIMTAADITKTGTWFGEFVSSWRQVREEQKDKIASLPNGFDSLIPEFEKRLYVREDSLVNQLGPNMRNLESVIDDAVYNLKNVA